MHARRVVAVLAATLIAAMLAGCGDNDYYRRDTYPDGKKIDSGPAAVERDTVGLLARGDVGKS